MKYHKSIILLVLIISAAACYRDGPDASADYIIHRELGVYYTDSLNRPLVGISQGVFRPDSIRIFFIEGGVQAQNGVTTKRPNGQYTCEFIYFQALSEKESDILYMDFVTPVYIQFDNRNIDTLILSKTSYDSIDVFYKHEIIQKIHALDTTRPFYITIKKDQ